MNQVAAMRMILLAAVPAALFCGGACSAVDSSIVHGATTGPAASTQPNVSPFIEREGQLPVVYRDQYVYTTAPLPADEAKAIAPWLPEDVTDFQFAHFSWHRAWQQWLMFRAPVDSCKAAAIQRLESWNKQNAEDAVSVELRPIDREAQRIFRENRGGSGPPFLPGPPYREESKEIPLGWFTPEEIEEGLEGGGRGRGVSIKVWVDTKNGVFFYQAGTGSHEPSNYTGFDLPSKGKAVPKD